MFATILAIQLIAFWLVFPKVVNVDVSKARAYDAIATALTLFVVWILYGQSAPSFRFIFFDTNWFIYGLLVYELLALINWYLYFKRKNVPQNFRALYGMRLN